MVLAAKNCISLIPDRELLHVVIRTVIDVEINPALYARQFAGIGVLPEFPRPFVFHLVHIIVGNPVRIVVEYRGTEVTLLEFIVGVDDWLHMVFVLHNVEPCEHIALEILHGTVFGLVLDIKHRWQVALFEPHFVQEVIGLVACRRLVAPEMVCAAYEPVFARLMEIVAELAVEARRTLGRLYHYEPQRIAFNHGIAQTLPVDVALIVRYVDAVYLVAFGIFRVAVKRAPSEPRGTYEERVEQPDVEGKCQHSAAPPCKARVVAQKSGHCAALCVLAGALLSCVP